MAQFEVTRSALATMADEFMQSTASFRGIMDDVSSVIKSLSASWESDAHSEFSSKYLKLEADLQGFDKVLTRYSEFLRETSTTYHTTDQKVFEETQVLNSESLFGR